MKNKIWEKNIKAMEKYKPELKNMIDENAKVDLTQKYKFKLELEDSYTEEYVTTVTTEDGKYYLAGKYYPNGMAERLAQKYQDAEYGAVIVCIGLSDGRLLNKLTETVGKEVTFVIYEPSLELFIHTLHNYDCTKFLERKGVNFVIGDVDKERLEIALSALLIVDNMLNIKLIIQGNYECIFNEEVKYAISKVNKNMRRLRIEWNTWMRFSKNTIANTIKNSKYLYQHYSLDTLYNTLSEDVPVIVVAAGPSLDKNIETLKLAKGKACILACDTALKPLMNRGIVPDFFFVLDPNKAAELFENPYIWDIPIVTVPNIPIEILKKHTGKKIFYLDNYLMMEMFKEVFGEMVDTEEHRMSSLPTGGSVATSAFSAGRLMGAKNVILIGQDLAFTGENEHASGTFEKDRKVTDMNQSDLVMVKDIYGQDVKTLVNLKYYLDWYVEEIKKYPELNVVDATEGGAFISGTQIMTLKEAIDKYCVGFFDSEKYMEQFPTHFNEEEQKKALRFMQNIPKRFEKIQQKIKEGKNWYKKLEKAAKKSELVRKDVDKILKKLKKVNEFMEEETLVDLIMDGVKREEYLVRTSIYRFEDDQQQNLLESAQMGIRLLESLEKTLEEMWPDIEELGEFDGTY